MNLKKIVAWGFLFLTLVVGSVVYYRNRAVTVYAENKGYYKICAKKRPLAVFVWSAVCGNCIYSLPHISALKQQFEELGGDFVIVLAEDQLVMRQMGRASFIRFNVAHLESYFDKDSRLARKYGINVLPTLLLFDKNGKLLKKIEGFVPWAEANNMNDALIAFDK